MTIEQKMRQDHYQQHASHKVKDEMCSTCFTAGGTEYRITFGKYQGKTLKEIEIEDKFYLRFLMDIARKEPEYYAKLLEALKNL